MMGNTITPVREWLANTVALTGMLVLFHSCLLEWILPKLYVRTKFVLFDWCCVTWEVEVTIGALERHEWFLFGCAGYLSGPAGDPRWIRQYEFVSHTSPCIYTYLTHMVRTDLTSVV